jgi:uncharacterized Zn finger protein
MTLGKRLIRVSAWAPVQDVVLPLRCAQCNAVHRWRVWSVDAHPLTVLVVLAGSSALWWLHAPQREQIMLTDLAIVVHAR